MSFVEALHNLVKETGMDKEEFCHRFGITEKQYLDFYSGNWNYDTRAMAALNSAWIYYETLKLDDKAPIQVAKSDYEYSKPIKATVQSAKQVVGKQFKRKTKSS